jgi:uncharacterized protein YebE (UPF0316 family)
MNLWTAVIFVFVFRLLDITLETARTILVVHKYKWLPAVVSFIEVFVWVWVFNEVIITHQNIWVYLAYAAGYSLGTLCGCKLGHYIVSRKGK